VDQPCAAACSLHSVHDEEKPFEMELSWICPASENEFRRVPADLSAEAERAAKAALADSDMCMPLTAAMLHARIARLSALQIADMLSVLQGGLIWVTFSASGFADRATVGTPLAEAQRVQVNSRPRYLPPT